MKNDVILVMLTICVMMLTQRREELQNKTQTDRSALFGAMQAQSVVVAHEWVNYLAVCRSRMVQKQILHTEDTLPY